MRTTTASTPQSPEGDSSPYEGEPKGLKVEPYGAIKCAAKAQTFFGGRGTDSPQSLRDSSPQRGEPFRLRAGRGAGGFGTRPYQLFV